MSTAAVAYSNYQKTNNMVDCAGRCCISLLGHFTHKLASLSVIRFYTFCTHRGAEWDWDSPTADVRSTEMLTNSVPRQLSDPQALTSSLPSSSVLISTADERSFASILIPSPLWGTFAHPIHPAHSLSSKLQQVQTFSDFGPPKYI